MPGQMRNHRIQNPVHILMAFSHSQTANCIAFQIQLRNTLGMVDTNIFQNPSLINPKENLLRIQGIFQAVQTIHLRLTTKKPTGGSLHGRKNIIPLRQGRRTLVKGHGNGRAQVGLNLHGFLRSHENPSSINMGAEFHPFFPNFSSGFGQTVNLKTAGIGKDGLVPIHHPV